MFEAIPRSFAGGNLLDFHRDPFAGIDRAFDHKESAAYFPGDPDSGGRTSAAQVSGKEATPEAAGRVPTAGITRQEINGAFLDRPTAGGSQVDHSLGAPQPKLAHAIRLPKNRLTRHSILDHQNMTCCP